MQLPMRLTFALAAVLAVTSIGCNVRQPTAPHHDESAQINLVYTPEVFSKSGKLLSRTDISWSGEATVRNGKIHSVHSLPVQRTALVDSYTLPDSLVQHVLPTLQFTTSANPDFTTYLVESERTDTTSETADGTNYTVIRQLGDYGQPVWLYSYRDGSLLSTTLYTWQQVTGGIRASQARTWDYSQPDVVVRTTVTMTAGNVVILTHGRQFGKPPLANLSPDYSQTEVVVRTTGTMTTGGVVTLTNANPLPQSLTAAPAFAYCAALLGEAILPARLEAMTMTSACGGAWVGFGLSVVGLVGASAGLVALPSPATVFFYFAAVGSLIHSTFSVGSACKKS